ncbi:Chitinase 1 [Chytriomyces hyalinus]|nr:Chitinase 1 [Chytriomyces hyalinus]
MRFSAILPFLTAALAVPFDASNSEDAIKLMRNILSGIAPNAATPEFLNAAVVQVPQFVGDTNAPAPAPQKEVIPEFVAESPSAAAPVSDSKTSAAAPVVATSASPAAPSPVVPPTSAASPVVSVAPPVVSADLPSPTMVVLPPIESAAPTTEAAPPAPAPSPETPAPAEPKAPTKPADGTIASLIDEAKFNNALERCGINKPDLYNALIGGFTAPISGLNELALLLGNTAHESGAYKYKEEIMCEGVTGVTGKCPYGWYHGRGYIQISWEDNYRKCGDAIGRDLVSNPDIVIQDDSVNWATVMWYWTSTVQPMLQKEGYTLGVSTKSINGYLECSSMGGSQIASGRISHIQCFQMELVGYSNDQSWC